MVWPICCSDHRREASVGSSRSSSRAPVRRMRPIASICCSPPESLVPWLARRSFRLGTARNLLYREAAGVDFRGSSRFSWTFRLAKMPRSSGQNATPSRAMRVGRERDRIGAFEPDRALRRGTIPMIDSAWWSCPRRCD